MFCLRSRAMPSAMRATSIIRPMTSTQIPQLTPSTKLSSRLFSSPLSTPTRFQPQTLGRLTTPTLSPSPLSSILSRTSMQTPLQTRSFSASASLGVRRVTFRPSRRVQKRRHGYLARKKDRNGRKILVRRILKGRKELSW